MHGQQNIKICYYYLKITIRVPWPLLVRGIRKNLSAFCAVLSNI